MKEPRILVLMTTYNGRAYVAEQIDSILDQRGVEVTLCICDDCSSDDTYAVLEAAAEESPNVHIRCNSANKGVVANFMDLIYGADAQAFDYFALSDQDDIWYPGKLRCAAARIESNTSRPELYYADVHNIDERGRSLGKEYEPYQVCARAPASLLLVQNWCLGCTTLLNPALVKLLQAHPVYDFGRMYDAWIHAVALYCGGFVFSDLAHAYLDRRITGHNTVGIMNEKRSAAYLAKKALEWLVHKDEATARKHTQMAAVLLREYEQDMDPEVARLVRAVAEREVNPKARRYLAGRKDIVMPTRTRTAWLHWMLRLNRF